MAADVQAGQTGIEEPAAQRPQTATLYLALFLSLLAFFLFLTSLTSFDPARAMAVIESVEARFTDVQSAAAHRNAVRQPFTGAAGDVIVADASFTGAVADAFSELVTGNAGQEGIAWHGVRIAHEALFVGATAALSANGRAAMDRAAAAMAAGADHRIDIAVGGNDGLALRRAAALGAVIAGVTGPAAVSLRTVPQDMATELVFFTVQTAGARS